VSFLAELRQSSRLAVGVAASAATVGAIYGYDSSNIAGALLYLTPEFGLTADTQGLVTTAVVIGEIAGALVGGTLANRLGRKPVMVGVAATFALFSLLSGLAWSVPSLVVARLLLGLTIGVSVVVAPVFIAESAPQRIRGSLLVMYQVATVTGIILGYLIAWGLAGSGNWRLMLGAAAIPGALITLALLRLPDTPRWYMMRGRVDEARTVLREIEPGADTEAELADIKAALNEEHGGGGVRELLRRPYLRAAIFVIGLGFFVQATGTTRSSTTARGSSRRWASPAAPPPSACPRWSRWPGCSPCSARWRWSTGSAVGPSCSSVSRSWCWPTSSWWSRSRLAATSAVR
jgi:MFS family permease